ncbi:MAG: bifunctional 2-C-methyl-D-erythritol 4-phosphate cytidylyltransferase/2-C-methyl-D-erythritol 2,4-cyclodiphosphate synthase [Robiginitomaculum sp.]|nr:bifunctional 2-C-methyl-D-erythritol 4-phosphate cytidylyltransferase/2-C-methyl-D-erythritol 2,4-cyclodiphosphate synthase [Robiginitomaculum sp.]
MHNNSSRKNAKIAVLIVAAGRGRRANSGTGSGLPKQYRTLDGQMVLTKTLKCFSAFTPIVVAIHPDDKEQFALACENVDGAIIPIHGGTTRTASVKAGLVALQSHAPDIVLIHDAARPFLSMGVIDNVVQALEKYTAAVPSLPIVDAVKTLDGSPVDRDQLRRVQTPQGFHYADILRAYANIPDGSDFADDIEVARQAGMSIGFCAGDPDNIKLTFADDFMSKNMISITGSGYDVHQICAGSSLFLCGVEIEAGFSLKGHSDADVGLHALTDALLGAISAGDIGDHFPPSDAKWKGADSTMFLAHAAKLARSEGATIDHVDVTLICEKPKIKPHRGAMRAKIAQTLNLSLNRVSVKATTTEGLGFPGRGEGIAASATASIRIPA